MFFFTDTPQQTPKMRRQYSDPDFLVIKLKYENYEAFEQLVISHITRHLDLPGTMLEAIRGKYDPRVDKVNNDKNAMQKIMSKLTSKKKEDKEEIDISEDVLKQVCCDIVFFFWLDIFCYRICKLFWKSFKISHFNKPINSQVYID